MVGISIRLEGGVEGEELGEVEMVLDGIGFEELGVDLGEFSSGRALLEER